MLCVRGLLKMQKAASKCCGPWITWDRKRHKQESYQCNNVIKCQDGHPKVALLEIACNGRESYRSWNWVWHENTMILGTVCKSLTHLLVHIPNLTLLPLWNHCFACSYQNNCQLRESVCAMAQSHIAPGTEYDMNLGTVCKNLGA